MIEKRPANPMTRDDSCQPPAGSVAVGTVGYDHAAWQGSFYDAELPADWRFLHYCNQFRALLLPADATREWIAGASAQLVDDSDDGFRFVVEVDDALLDDDRLCAALDSLGVRLWGIVYRAGPDSRPGAALRRLAAARPLCVDSGERVSTLAGELNVSTVWRPPAAPAPKNGPLIVARVAEAGLVETRRILEAIGAPAVSGARRGVFFECPNTAFVQARDARIMAELMGL